MGVLPCSLGQAFDEASVLFRQVFDVEPYFAAFLSCVLKNANIVTGIEQQCEKQHFLVEVKLDTIYYSRSRIKASSTYILAHDQSGAKVMSCFFARIPF